MNEPANETKRVENAKRTLETLLRMMGFEATVETFLQEDGDILLHIESPDAGRLIGRGAQVLDALQLLLNRMLLEPDRPVRYVVDVERYRERRKDRILKEAIEAANEVRRLGHAIRLAPMGAADRRIVHQALKDRPDVHTASEIVDEGGLKQVVVYPAEAPPAEPTAQPVE